VALEVFVDQLPLMERTGLSSAVLKQGIDREEAQRQQATQQHDRA